MLHAEIAVVADVKWSLAELVVDSMNVAIAISAILLVCERVR